MAAKNIEDAYPLSPMQEGLLFHSLYDQKDVVYVTHIACTLENLDVSAFERAWQKTVDRHPVLRTAFVWQDVKKPLQVVGRQVKLSIEKDDWRQFPPGDQRARLEERLRLERSRDFKLSKAPLMRLVLMQIGDDSHYFIYSHHHLLLDGWSDYLLLREVFALYEAYREGRDVRLPQPRPYRDYIAWLRGRDSSKVEEFWRRTLEGFTSPTQLGADRAPGSLPSAEEEDAFFRLPADKMKALNAFAREHQLTLSTIILGAWSLVLNWYSGEQDVVFGVTVSGRPAEMQGVEAMMGVFINTLPLRVPVPPAATLTGWLMEIQKLQVEMRKYEYSSLAQVQGWSEIPRGQPLFESIINFENHSGQNSLVEPGASLKISDVQSDIKKNYPIFLKITPGDELLVKISYDRLRFDPAAIQRMFSHMRVALEGILSNPSARPADMRLLTGAERHQLFSVWNATESDYPQGRCIHELFEAQVRRTPDEIALTFEHDSLTFDQLNRRANQLARHLQKLGVSPESHVLLCLERSTDMIVGLLGILKAGGAYVPIDPKYPKDRVALIAEDTRSRVLLTQQSLVDDLPKDKARVVCIDSDWEGISKNSSDNTVSNLIDSNPAYVIYTSGSTGKPKGVVIEHRQAINYLNGIIERLGFTGRASYAMAQPLTFDSCQTVILPPLTTGGTLHVISQDRATDAEKFAEYFVRHKIDGLKITPTHLAALQDFSRPGEGLPKRWLVVGGEASHWEWIRGLQDLAPDCSIFNHYGPTEATVGMLTFRVRPDQVSHPSSIVPMGHPLPNTRAYALNRQLQPLPVGIPGELFIGGRCLARCYLNRPAITAEKFIPDPFSSAPGARMYRTGDLVRYHADGSLEFLGRMDNQVKIRGFRIELGEIESILNQHPAVRESVVLAREDVPGHRFLSAYLVMDKGESVSRAELQGYLRERLPEYMIPSAMVTLEQLPLNSNGKVDRRALPAPDLDARADSDSYQPARSRVEQELVAIWQQVLRTQSVGIHDNFFELGGDSILSIQVTAKANQAGIKITPRQVFEQRTIAELAAVAGTSQIVAADQGMISGPVVLTPIQHWLLEQKLADLHHWNQAVMLESATEIDVDAMRRAVTALLEHHDALRLRVRQEAGGYVQEIAEREEAEVVSFVELEEGADVEEEASRVQSSLDLERGPVVRVEVMKLEGERGWRVLIVIHHLAVDGVSWRVVLEDLVKVYESEKEGRQARLGAKTTSYKEWARRLERYAESEEMKQEVRYWSEIGRQEVRKLRVDEEGWESNDVGSARRVEKELSEEETRALLRDVNGTYKTQTQEVLLSGLAEGVRKWSGQVRVMVEVEGHGREQEAVAGVDLTRTVGWFTTKYPLFLEASSSGDISETIKRVKERAREVPSGGMGYGVLKYLSKDEEVRRVMESVPEAEISFNYLGQLDSAVEVRSGFKPANESVGRSRSSLGKRKYLLEMIAGVVGGRLQVGVIYSEKIHERETIEALATHYLDSLRSIIEHCLSPEAGGYTPSDFPKANFNQKELDELIEELTEATGD